ncbi:MAG: glycosyltransferase family 4 protein [Bacteroidota bacterium]
MHILYLIQYFGTPDDPTTSDRAFDFVNEFARQGHQVTLLTSDAFISDPSHLGKHLHSNIHVHLIHQPYANTFGIFQRVFAFLLFTLKAFYRATVQVKSVDLIYASSTPLTVPMIGMVLSKLWNIPWVFELRDLWPDFLFDMDIITAKWVKSLLWHLETWLYSHANHLITLSSTATDILVQQKGVPAQKVTTYPNGCPYPYPQPKRSKSDLVGTNLAERPLVIYAGTLGMANHVPWLIEAAKSILTHTPATVAIIGDGSYRNRVTRWAATLSPALSQRLILKPYISRSDVSDWFWASDFNLISFLPLPSLAATSPNKYFHAVATQSIPLTNHPGWIGHKIRESGAGLWLEDPSLAGIKLQKWFMHADKLAMAQNQLRSLTRVYRRDRMAQNLLTLFTKIIKP